MVPGCTQGDCSCQLCIGTHQRGMWPLEAFSTLLQQPLCLVLPACDLPQTHLDWVFADFMDHQTFEELLYVFFTGKVRHIIFPCNFWWDLSWRGLWISSRHGMKPCDLQAALLTCLCWIGTGRDQCMRNTATVKRKKWKTMASKALKHVSNSCGLQWAVRTCWIVLLTGINQLWLNLDREITSSFRSKK